MRTLLPPTIQWDAYWLRLYFNRKTKEALIGEAEEFIEKKMISFYYVLQMRSYLREGSSSYSEFIIL